MDGAAVNISSIGGKETIMLHQTENSSAREGTVHGNERTLEEVRAIRTSVESMEKMLRKIYEIAEAQAGSFARQEPAHAPSRPARM
jgi:hypothetical protein